LEVFAENLGLIAVAVRVLLSDERVFCGFVECVVVVWAKRTKQDGLSA
jgi:hypothetical protein